jgi:hypothetical protein
LRDERTDGRLLSFASIFSVAGELQEDRVSWRRVDHLAGLGVEHEGGLKARNAVVLSYDPKRIAVAGEREAEAAQKLGFAVAQREAAIG